MKPIYVFPLGRIKSSFFQIPELSSGAHETDVRAQQIDVLDPQIGKRTKSRFLPPPIRLPIFTFRLRTRRQRRARRLCVAPTAWPWLHREASPRPPSRYRTLADHLSHWSHLHSSEALHHKESIIFTSPLPSIPPRISCTLESLTYS